MKSAKAVEMLPMRGSARQRIWHTLIERIEDIYPMGFPYVDTIAKRSDGPGENDLLNARQCYPGRKKLKDRIKT